MALKEHTQQYPTPLLSVSHIANKLFSISHIATKFVG
jgi:Gpi18-like mannosyltransferase